MKKYTAAELEGFLKSIDSFLTKEAKIIIIGGTAAALAYKVTMATQDIDTWNSTKAIDVAYKKAKIETKMEIPLGPVPIQIAPYQFEDRLLPYKKSTFKFLRVFVPEVEDLILMKALRAEANDLKAIEQMIKNKKVKSDTLIDRYVTELSQAIGNKRNLDLNFLGMIARCYGDKTADSAQKIIDSTKG